MLRHSKVVINEFQCFLELLCPKVKVLKDSLGEKIINL
jgi:hypothetical protein